MKNLRRMRIYFLLLLLFIMISHHVFSNEINIIENQEGIWVYEQNNQRCLSFSKPSNGMNQTCINLKNTKEIVFSYQKMVLGALYLNANPRRILMIGLGGGTIATALSSLLPNAQIDIVEINSKILEIAEKYFEFKHNERIRLFIDDGFKFVTSKSHGKYDLIIVDAFTEEYVPQSFISHEFVMSLKEILNDNGVIAVNTFVNSQYKKVEEKLYYEVFGQFYDMIYRNRIIMVGPILSKDKLEHNADILNEKFIALNIDKQFLLERFNKIFFKNMH